MASAWTLGVHDSSLIVKETTEGKDLLYPCCSRDIKGLLVAISILSLGTNLEGQKLTFKHPSKHRCIQETRLLVMNG